MEHDNIILIVDDIVKAGIFQFWEGSEVYDLGELEEVFRTQGCVFVADLYLYRLAGFVIGCMDFWVGFGSIFYLHYFC